MGKCTTRCGSVERVTTGDCEKPLLNVQTKNSQPDNGVQAGVWALYGSDKPKTPKLLSYSHYWCTEKIDNIEYIMKEEDVERMRTNPKMLNDVILKIVRRDWVICMIYDLSSLYHIYNHVSSKTNKSTWVRKVMNAGNLNNDVYDDVINKLSSWFNGWAKHIEDNKSIA